MRLPIRHNCSGLPGAQVLTFIHYGKKHTAGLAAQAEQSCKPQCRTFTHIQILHCLVQLKSMERQCSVGERIRAIKRAQLTSALTALDEQSRQAAADLQAARSAMQAALEHP